MSVGGGAALGLATPLGGLGVWIGFCTGVVATALVLAIMAARAVQPQGTT